MSLFSYKVKDPTGKTQKGVIDAGSEKQAEESLLEKGFIILSIIKKNKPTSLSLPLNFFSGVSGEEVTMFTRQLSVMIAATVPLVKALKILVRQQDKIAFKVVLSDIAEEVDGGAKLSASMAKYPKVFNNFYVYMIRSGETTGKLEQVLTYLADQKEKNMHTTKKIKNAMIYPVFIIVGLVAVAIIVLVFVMPTLLEVVSQGGNELPWTTRLLLDVSNFLKTWWWVLIVIIAGIVGGIWFANKNEKIGRWFDTFKLKLPIYGNVYEKIILTRLSENLSTLLESGVPVAKSLRIVADLVGNRLYKKIILETISEVEAGNSISTVFAANKSIPLILNQVLTVGEETGRMDEVLKKLGKYYEKEVDTAVDAMVNLIEPIVLVVLGVGVGILVAGVLLPMYNIAGSL